MCAPPCSIPLPVLSQEGKETLHMNLHLEIKAVVLVSFPLLRKTLSLKAIQGRKGLFRPIQGHSSSSSKSEQELEAETMKEHGLLVPSLAHSASFLIQPRTTCPGWCCPQRAGPPH